MEFIAMTGCLSGTKRSSGNFLRDFKGGGGQGWGGGVVRTRGGCSYGPEVDSVLWWEHRRIAGPPGCEGAGLNSHPGRVLLRSGGEFGFLVGAGVGACL